MSKKSHDLGIRTLINGLSAALIALFIFFAEIQPLRWIFAAAAAAIAAIAVWEYNQIVKKKGLFPAVTLSMVAVALYVFAVFFKTQQVNFSYHSLLQNAPEIILGLFFFSCFVYYTRIGQPPITNIATTFFGIIYIGVPIGLIVHIMYFPAYDAVDARFQGSWWIIYLVAVTKSADIGGYFVGRHLGKRKLASSLSPNKTVEGALGGLIVSIIISLLICFLGKRIGHTFHTFSYLKAFWLGGLIGILGQMGDLAESFLKRDAGVKDSNTIPGVGGLLDMIDSLLFTAPIVYIFIKILYS